MYHSTVHISIMKEKAAPASTPHESSAARLFLSGAAKKPEKTKAPEPGHGLGLKIIGQIVERCNGLLEMEQGEDSYRVTLALPLR